MSNSDVVMQFIDAWNRMDFDAVVALCSEDIEYHNIPMEPVYGREGVRDVIALFGEPESIEWVVHHIAENGNVVLTERTDKFVFEGGTLALPVMGTFEIVDGKIAKWRDYFDMAQFADQMAEIQG